MHTDELNFFYGPIERLRHLIAATPTFQLLVGATGSPAEKYNTALESVHEIGLAGADIAPARPYAEVDAGLEFNAQKNSSSSSKNSGTLYLCLEADVPEDKRAGYKDAGKWFYEITGNLIQELLADSLSTDPTPHNLLITGISLSDGPPARTDPTAADGDYYQVFLEIQWGLK